LNSTNTTSSLCKYASECSWLFTVGSRSHSSAKAEDSGSLNLKPRHSGNHSGKQLCQRLQFTAWARQDFEIVWISPLKTCEFGLKGEVGFEIGRSRQMRATEPRFAKSVSRVPCDFASDQKGWVRLRVSPTGEKGIGLDFAHTDIQWLFEEKTILSRLLALAFVEVGQRRKKLIWSETESRFRLVNPELSRLDIDFCQVLSKKPSVFHVMSARFRKPGDIANRKTLRDHHGLCFIPKA